MFPYKIHLTCKDKNNINNKVWKKCYEKYIELYPDYQIIIWDNQDIHNLVKKYFPEHHNVIKKITNGGLISDTFRYLIMYLEGGIYSDLDCLPIKHIRTLFSDIHYHGNIHNLFFIYPQGKTLQDTQWDFYKNPCNNCKFIKKENNVETYQCLGHKYITENTNMIICKEFSDIYQHKNNLNQLCQWFIIAKPGLPIFLDLYNEAYNNIKKNIEDVLSATGPKMFTKLINRSSMDKSTITILPPDFFCAGSGGLVPITKNSYIHHQFTNCWKR